MRMENTTTEDLEEPCKEGDVFCRHSDPPYQYNNSSTDVVISFTDAGSNCTSDALGQFGSSSGQVSKLMQYEYELETKPDLDAAVLAYVILPNIERQINDVLVSVIFENCGTRRRLYASGLTSFPPDRISPNGECTRWLTTHYCIDSFSLSSLVYDCSNMPTHPI